MRTLLALTLLALTFTAHAEADVHGTIEPDVWNIDTEVTIHGANLVGPMPSQSKLCVAPEANKEDLRCFLSNHTNIIYWTAGTITFVPPKNTPPIGVVVLILPSSTQECTNNYGKLSCAQKTVRPKYEIGTYRAHPSISEIVDLETQQVVHSFVLGRTYEIRGYRFGDAPFGLYVGRRQLDRSEILVWSSDSIRFHFSETPEDPTGIHVHNGSSKSAPWPIEKILLNPPASLSSSSTSETSNTASSATAPAEEPKAVFIDVATIHPYFDAISWGKASGFLQGYQDGSFRPDRPVTRAEFLKIMLGEASKLGPVSEGTVTFSDVDPNAWYAAHVRFAAAKGVIQGYADGTFRPERAVNWAEALKMMYRAFAIETPDAPPGSEWYTRYLEDAKTQSYLFTNSIDVSKQISRKDVVWIVWKILQRKMEQQT